MGGHHTRPRERMHSAAKAPRTVKHGAFAGGRPIYLHSGGSSLEDPLPRTHALLLAVTLSCPAIANGADAVRATRVLFVGNSHTATNDLPSVVGALAQQRGVVLDVEVLAEPGMSLGDHLAGRRLRGLLGQDWDWVLLQQGPSSLPESRDDLVRSAAAIAAELRGRPARVALWSAWPHHRHRASSLAAEESYRQAAAASGGCVMPVATAWRHALAADQAPRLYQRDRLHATPGGTLLAALSILPGLLGGERSGVSPTADEPAADRSTRLHVLRAAAWRAHQEEPRRCSGA